jgi:hypothetical protein
MNPLQIALIVIGIIIILVSCILVDKSQKLPVQPSGGAFSLEDSLTQEDKEQLKDKLEELLAEVSEEAIVRVDDTLSKISNEKIIAVNEFSDQILEKINRNHEEVIFLYNMLNDKEKELKSAVKEIEASKKKVQDILETKAKVDNTPKTAAAVKAPQPAKNITQADKIIEKPVKTTGQVTSQEASTVNAVSSNNNSQILALYSQGKSVMEISKLLDLGQGEVKLVIELFKGKKA